MTKEEELLEQMKAIMAENEALKARNVELKRMVDEQKNWNCIREGLIVPMLRERYGQGKCLFTMMATNIANVVKLMIDVEKITAINETNYEEAREIAKELTETICKFEWKQIRRLQASSAWQMDKKMHERL